MGLVSRPDPCEDREGNDVLRAGHQAASGGERATAQRSGVVFFAVDLKIKSSGLSARLLFFFKALLKRELAAVTGAALLGMWRYHLTFF